MSVQQDSSEQIGSGVPTQRTEATAPPAVHHAAPDEKKVVPAGPDVTAAHPGAADVTMVVPAAADETVAHPAVIAETMVLPAFVTGKKEREPKPAEPVRHQATPEGALPASERGMLIFVAALLGVGTIAVVTVMGLGGFSKPRPAHTSTTVAVAPPATSTPSPSPTPVASSAAPAPPPPSPTPPPPRRTTPARVTLGALTASDPAAFCTFSQAGRLRHGDGIWMCSGTSSHPPMTFGPNDVCQWRYLDKTAYAVVGDPNNPTTWTCFT